MQAIAATDLAQASPKLSKFCQLVLSNNKSKAVFLSLLFLRNHPALLYVRFYFLLPILSIKALVRAGVSHLASWLVHHFNDHVCTREFCFITTAHAQKWCHFFTSFRTKEFNILTNRHRQNGFAEWMKEGRSTKCSLRFFNFSPGL